VDVRALLDAGVTRADSELAMQPQARAELIGLIAKLRSGLGDDEESLQLLDRQQEALRSLGNSAPANLLLDSAALRAYSLRELGRNQECLTAVGPTLAIAQDAADAYPLPAAEFLSQLGRCHAALAGRAVARDLFGQALQLRKAHAAATALTAESESDLAMLQLADGRSDVAVRGLREALGHLRYNGGEQNALGAEIWSGLGAAFKAQDNATEAEAAYRQALDIAIGRFGASHPRTGAIQSALASVLASSGQLAEAALLLSQAKDGVAARWGANSPQVANHESLRGMVALERDQPAEAEALMADAIRIWRSRGAIGSHAWDLCHLAQAQTELARDPQAEANRRECLALLKAQPDANEVPAVAALVQAALDRSDTFRARAWLAQLPQEKTSGGPELTLARARLAQMTGEADAGQQIEALLAQLPDDRRHRRLRWQALSMQAAQACLGGRNDFGVALRDRIVAEAQLMEPEHRRQQRRLVLLGAPCQARG